MSQPLRVLVISPFLEEGVDYQEMQISRVLHQLGHQVTVITTDRSNLDKESRLSGSNFPFEVIRLHKLLRIRDTFYPFDKLNHIVAGLNPDISLLIHPSHGLGYFLLNTIPTTSKVASFFGDLNNRNKIGQTHGLKGNPLIQKIIKNSWYRKVISRSDLVVATTNETVGLLQSIVGRGNSHKFLMTGLGYDSSTYYYDPKLRENYRRDLQIPEGYRVFVTLTRVIEGKPIVKWAKSVLAGIADDDKAIYVIAGFMDTVFSRNAKGELLSLEQSKRLLLIDYTDRVFNNGLFNCADFSVWFSPTISIQQSMGTGLPAIMPMEGTLDHLIKPGLNGLYYSSFDELASKIRTLREWPHDRSIVVQNNRMFSYESILESIFSRLGA